MPIQKKIVDTSSDSENEVEYTDNRVAIHKHDVAYHTGTTDEDEPKQEQKTKPKRTLSDKQREALRLGRLKRLENKKLINKKKQVVVPKPVESESDREPDSSTTESEPEPIPEPVKITKPKKTKVVRDKKKKIVVIQESSSESSSSEEEQVVVVKKNKKRAEKKTTNEVIPPPQKPSLIFV